MAEAKVYVETSVVSYLTSRPNRDVVVAGHQQVTQDWWGTQREQFHLVISELVVREASAGDAEAAAARLRVLEELEVLEISEDALSLASKLVEQGAIPKKAVEDALHIGVAVTNGVEYLLTWNYKHLANAAMRTSIEDICRANGYEPSIICTPEELSEV